MTQTVRQDVRELVEAARHPDQFPTLEELDPRPTPWWHLPLGFASLVAAGALLVAAGGVQTRVQHRVRARHAGKAVSIEKKLHRPPKAVPQPGQPRHPAGESVR